MNKFIGAFLIIFAIASGQTHAIAHEDMRSLLKSTVDKPGRVKFSLKEYSPDETKSFIGNSFPRHLVLRALSRNSHRPNETWKSFLTDPESGLGAESFYAQFCSLHDKLMPVKISYRNRSPRTVQINLKNLYNNPFYTPFDLTDLKQKYPTPTPGVARLCKGLMTSLILCGSMLGLLPSIIFAEECCGMIKVDTKRSGQRVTFIPKIQEGKLYGKKDLFTRIQRRNDKTNTR